MRRVQRVFHLHHELPQQRASPLLHLPPERGSSLAARLQRRLELPVLVPQLLLQRAHVLLVAEVGAQLLEGGRDLDQARAAQVSDCHTFAASATSLHYCSCRGERAPAVLDELGQRVLAGGGGGGAGQDGEVVGAALQLGDGHAVGGGVALDVGKPAADRVELALQLH